MNSAKRHIEVPNHFAERGGERRSSSDQHVIMAGQQTALGCDMPCRLPQPTPDPIAFHSISYLSRYRKSDPDGPIVVPAPRLYGQQAGRQPHSVRGGPKFASAPEPFDDDCGREGITH